MILCPQQVRRMADQEEKASAAEPALLDGKAESEDAAREENAGVAIVQVEEEEEPDPFSRPRKRKKVHADGANKKKKDEQQSKRLKIVLSSVNAVEDETAGAKPEKSQSSEVADSVHNNVIPYKFESSQPSEDFVADWEEDEQEDFDAEIERQLEDTLSFFQETHEEQSPAYVAFQEQMAERERQKRLTELDQLDRKGRKEIEDLIAQLCKEKQNSADRSLEKYRERAANEEKQASQRLMHGYRQKTQSNLNKIGEGVKILERKNQKEVQEAMQSQQYSATNQWQHVSQQIQAAHQRRLQAFQVKGEELKKKTEAEFQMEKEKIRKQYNKKLTDIDSSRQKLFAKIIGQFQQARQRHLRRHLQRIMKEKEALLPSRGTDAAGGESGGGGAHTHSSTTGGGGGTTTVSPREIAKTTMDRAELNPPAPIVSAEPWAQDLSSTTVSGAAVRHKHRKSVMSQTVRQLSLEIHNEGIWISCVSESSSDEHNKSSKSKSSGDNGGGDDLGEQEFVPWGHKAHTVLNSVVCGEIPAGYERILESHPQAADLSQVQGSQVRCIINDMRTSLETATLQRSKALKQQDEIVIQSLEAKIAKFNQHVADAEQALKTVTAHEQNQMAQANSSADDLKNAHRIQQEFQAKFQNFLGPDGNPVPDASPNDRKELQKAMHRYKTNLDTAAQKAAAAKQMLADATAKREKLELIVKTTQKNVVAATNMLKKKRTQLADAAKGKVTKLSEAALAEKAATRVKEVIGSLQTTAEHRRQEYDKKKSASLSSAWVQSFPGLPSSVKKSIWHRLHRRKQQIILRPSEESLIVELHASVAHAVAPKFKGLSPEDQAAAIETEILKAEQRFLVATHPLGDASLSTVPPSKSSDEWAEPGWQLNLEVPEEPDDFRILPCAPSFPILERNLAEIASAPGRQAASMLRASHLRCLASPMSIFSVASAPAEENSSFSQSRTFADGDPLNVTDGEMELGYTFSLKPPVKHPAPRRKSATAKTQPQASSAAALDESTSSKPETKSGSKSKAQKGEPKRRRSSGGSKKSAASTAQSQAPAPASVPSPRSQRSMVPTPTVPPPSQSAYSQAQLTSQQQAQQQRQQQQAQQQQQVQQQVQQQQHYQQQQMRMQGSPPSSQQQAAMQGVPPQSQPTHMRHPGSQQPRHYSPQHRSSDPYYQQRMMQHQQVPSPRHHPQQMNPSYAQMQHLQQFYPPPLGHPMHMQGRQPMPNPQQQQSVQGSQQQGQSGQQQQRSQGSRDPNDPLYMLGKK